MIAWIYIIGVLLLACLCWKEFRRPNRARLSLRIAACIVAVASLTCLAPPLVRKVHKQTPENISKPVALPTGIQSIYWRQQLNAGESLQLQGRFNNNTAKPVKLLLSAFSEGLDSISIPAKTQQAFSLQTRPRHKGRAVYQLTAIGKDTLEKEDIPLTVKPIRPLKILILAAAPDFEHKFLANWLSQHGNIVAMRTAISKNKFSYSFLDTARFQLERLTPTVLAAFDLLISDAAALNGSELAGIRTQIAEKGLGLVIRADSTKNVRSFYTQPFPIVAFTDRSERAISLQAGNNTIGSLAIDEPLYIQSLPGTRPLVWDVQQHTMVSSGLYGTGRLVASTLRNTWSWLLSGNTAAYQSLWSLILQTAARPRSEAVQWHFSNVPAKVRMPAKLYLEAAEQPHAVTVNDAAISLEQDAALPSQWKGTYWPVKPGWQAAVANEGDTSWWYVFGEKDWQPILAAEKLQRPNEVPAQPQEETGSMSQWYFAVLLLLALIFLWVEEKLGLAA